MLRGTIRRNVGIAAQTHSGGDIDNTPVPRVPHITKNLFGAEVCAGQVQTNGLVQNSVSILWNGALSQCRRY